MTGYQEVLTDPSYRGQIVVMTQPHIGNYGTAPDARRVAAARGSRASSPASSPASPRASDGEEGLVAYLRRHGVPALEGIDTRALVRRLRERGALRGVLTSERSDVDRLGRRARRLPDHDRPRPGRRGDLRRAPTRSRAAGRGRQERCHLAVYDFGVKTNILRSLAGAGRAPDRAAGRARRPPSAWPWRSTAWCCRTARATPSRSTGIIEHGARARSPPSVPVFGICLGHQLLGLALGGAHLQAQVRPPRRQPAGARPAHRQGGDHQPEPRLRGRPGLAARRLPGDPAQPERRHGRGLRGRGPAGLLGAVPPRGRARARTTPRRSSTASSTSVCPATERSAPDDRRAARSPSSAGPLAWVIAWRFLRGAAQPPARRHGARGAPRHRPRGHRDGHRHGADDRLPRGPAEQAGPRQRRRRSPIPVGGDGGRA